MMPQELFRQLMLRALCVAISWLVSGQAPERAAACTIVSGISKDGQVWNANNEDGPDGAANFITVFPSTNKGEYGYFVLSYFSPISGETDSIQGGMNEAGLTFDFNAMKEVKDFAKKKPFPAGDAGILPHILASMESTEQVVEFFETYWFENNFTSAQMHVADRQGRFAIIGPSGTSVLENGEPLVSTNFDIVGREDGASCWRYPIASHQLKEHGAGLSTMVDICQKTSQSNGGLTLYSNVQNLTTGDVWFFSDRKYETPIKTNISKMLSKGRQSYSFDDLKALIEYREAYNRAEPKKIEVPQATIERYTGTYRHPFGLRINIELHDEGIELSTEGNPTSVAFPQSANTFFFPDDDTVLTFEAGESGTHMRMSLIKNGNRSFTAKRVKK